MEKRTAGYYFGELVERFEEGPDEELMICPARMIDLANGQLLLKNPVQTKAPVIDRSVLDVLHGIRSSIPWSKLLARYRLWQESKKPPKVVGRAGSILAAAVGLYNFDTTDIWTPPPCPDLQVSLMTERHKLTSRLVGFDGDQQVEEVFIPEKRDILIFEASRVKSTAWHDQARAIAKKAGMDDVNLGFIAVVPEERQSYLTTGPVRRSLAPL